MGHVDLPQGQLVSFSEGQRDLIHVVFRAHGQAQDGLVFVLIILRKARHVHPLTKGPQNLSLEQSTIIRKLPEYLIIFTNV